MLLSLVVAAAASGGISMSIFVWGCRVADNADAIRRIQVCQHADVCVGGAEDLGPTDSRLDLDNVTLALPLGRAIGVGRKGCGRCERHGD